MDNKQFIAFTEDALFKARENPTSQTIEYALNVAKLCVNQFKDLEYANQISAECKRIILEDIFNSDLYKVLAFYDHIRATTNNQAPEIELLWKILLFEGQNLNFDSYLLYLEKNREPKDRFYFPKRKCFLKIGLIQALQDLIDDKLDILTISLPPGTGKTTLEKFLHTAIMGWFPNEYNLFFSHSAGITRMYYDGVLSIITDSLEYTWQEIFPKAKITTTNAKMEQINIGTYKPFPNLQTASVGSEMAGKVRASYLLLCDDLIGKIDEALNKNILEKLWNIYSTDARQRKVTGCKELHIATRWSVSDIIGRLQQVYGDSDRARFVAVPDIDETTGESNFLFDINGFTVDFYHDQELLMDDVSYRCLYKNDPIEREGLLYTSDTIRRYITLPEGEPDAILGVCDTKTTGKDFMVLPVFYQFGNDYYLVDCICDDSSDFGVQEERLARILIDHNVQQCEFESNAGGSRLALNVAELIKSQSKCNITTKPTETNKETRIIVNSDWIIKHCLFKDKENYSVKTDYGRFMDFMLSYSVAGKNKHDDVPDCLANFALFVDAKFNIRQSTIMRSPF